MRGRRQDTEGASLFRKWQTQTHGSIRANPKKKAKTTQKREENEKMRRGPKLKLKSGEPQNKPNIN